MDKEQLEELVLRIKSGEVGVMPTDTIYGITASIHFPDQIEKIYRVTGRPTDKPFIVLISSLSQLAELGIHANEEQQNVFAKLWPGPISAILPAEPHSMKHIHRGKETIAVRLPEVVWLRELIDKTGPIVATSANRSGEPTPTDIAQIRHEVPDLDFYLKGEVGSTPSRLVVIDTDGSLKWLER